MLETVEIGGDPITMLRQLATGKDGHSRHRHGEYE